MSIEGAEACSIFCGTPDPGVVLTALREHLTVEDAGAEWERVAATGPAGRMVLTRTMFVGPGGPFSHMILGASNAVRHGSEEQADARPAVLRLLETCDMILGIRFDPVTGPDDARVAATYAVAAATSGLVFDGNAMLDARGDVLVSI